MTETLKPIKTLNPHQEKFVDADEPYIGLFGGVGNGKTWAACMKSIELLTQYPNNLGLVGRLTYPELRDSTKEVFMSCLAELYPPGAYSHNKSENSVTFWNKSSVIFRHLDDQGALLGPNLGFWYIDQAEEVDEEAFKMLKSRLRRPKIGELKGMITGNPKGHDWVYYAFGMERAKGSQDWKGDEYHRMITAPTHSNAANLPKNYIDQLLKSYSKEWFNRYVLGGWDVFEGQIFDLSKITGFDKLPKITSVFTACDPAISKKKGACNTAFCTFGVGEDGHVYDLETIAGQWSFLETLEEARKLITRQHPSYLGVEDVAYQSSLAEACRRYFPEINVVNLKADRDKFRRAKSVSHIVSKGLFHTNNKELLSELTAFDPDAEGKERKDRVDAMVHCLHMVQSYAPIQFLEVDKEAAYADLDSGQAWFKRTMEYRKSQEQQVEGVEIFGEDYNLDNNFY